MKTGVLLVGWESMLGGREVNEQGVMKKIQDWMKQGNILFSED